MGSADNRVRGKDLKTAKAAGIDGFASNIGVDDFVNMQLKCAESVLCLACPEPLGSRLLQGKASKLADENVSLIPA